MGIADKPSTGRNNMTTRSAASMSGPLMGVNICVIGGGFVGLVTAAGFAKFGHNVICIEKNPKRLAELEAGRLPFFERDLEELMRANMECGRLSFSADLKKGLEDQKAIFAAVGTPSMADGRADMGSIMEAMEALSRDVKPGQIIVLKSTVPLGTARMIKQRFQENGFGDQTISVISNPEFLREGTAVYDFFHPQRIVIGGDSAEAIEIVKHIYRLGMAQSVPIVVTNNETAEMIKYASNVYLATKIGFVNELAGLCDHVGVNIIEVARAMGLDPRISPEFLNPGPGWGGSCLPKDVMEFLGLAKSKGFSLLITQAVHDANKRQHEFVVGKIEKLLGSLKGKQIGALGLAFKADTSDLRDSPAISIIGKLINQGARIKAFDPAAGEEAKLILPELEIVGVAAEVANNSDCVVILTEWPEFQLLDWQSIGEKMRTKNLVDTRNLLTPEYIQRYGYRYISMGQV